MRIFYLTACLLLIASQALADSITIECAGVGDGWFRLGRDDDGSALGGPVSLTIYVEDVDSPGGTYIQLRAQLIDDPDAQVSDRGIGYFEVSPGSIRFAIDQNEGLAGYGYATLYGDRIQPGGFPDLAGAAGDFILDDGWGQMTGTMNVPAGVLAAVPEPASVVLLPIGLMGMWWARRRRPA